MKTQSNTQVHASTQGLALCSKYLDKNMSEEEVERDARPLQTISQCRHSSGKMRRERERKTEKKEEENVAGLQMEGRKNMRKREMVRKVGREGRRTPNVKQQLKWKNSSLDSSSLANEDH